LQLGLLLIHSFFWFDHFGNGGIRNLSDALSPKPTTPPYLSNKSLPMMASFASFTYTGWTKVTPAKVNSSSIGPFVHNLLLPSAIVKLVVGAFVSTISSGKNVLREPVSTTQSPSFFPTTTLQRSLRSGTVGVSIALGFLQLFASLLSDLSGCSEMRHTAPIAFALWQNFRVWPGLPHFLQLIFANDSHHMAT